MPSRLNDHEQPADAIAMFTADHQRVKDLFAPYAATTDRAMKRTLAAQIFVALDTHAQLEDHGFPLRYLRRSTREQRWATKGCPHTRWGKPHRGTAEHKG